MKMAIKETVKITLVLKNYEAHWLKCLMQNPIGCEPNQEHEEDKKMRELFWTTLERVK